MGAIVNMCDCNADNTQNEEYDQYGNKFLAPERQSVNSRYSVNSMSKEEEASLVFVRNYK